MSAMNRKALQASVAAIALTVAANAAYAGGFAIREQSALGLGNAFAGAAAGGAGIGSMFWNPATMTDFAGWNSSWNFSAIIPNAKATAGAGSTLLGLGASSGSLGLSAVVPASYTSYQLNERIWIGLATGAPNGLATKNARPNAGQIHGLTSEVFSTEVMPTFALKVNEWFSIGGGVRAQYFKVGLTNATAAVANPNVQRLTGDGYALGYSLGATIKPGPNTEIGIGYRSRMRPELDGRLENPGLPSANGIRTAVRLPDQITIGARHNLTQQWTVLAGFEWTHWRLFNNFPVISTGPVFPAGATIANLAFQWRNGWYASAGAEYKWSPNLTLRAGIGYEHSPVTSQNRGVRLPDANRTWATTGFSYKYSEKLSIDVSYAHLFVGPAPINLVAGNPGFIPGVNYVGRAKAHFDMVSLGLNYRWDSPAAAVIAKY